MTRSFAAIGEAAGAAPRGFRAPYWSLSPRTLALAAELGFVYDSSLMADDVHLYRVRTATATRSTGPCSGRPARSWRCPSRWALDDWPQFEPGENGVGPMSAPSKVEEIWTEELRYAWTSEPGGVAHDHDAPGGDRPRASHRDARAVHRRRPRPRWRRLRPPRSRRRPVARGGAFAHRPEVGSGPRERP